MPISGLLDDRYRITDTSIGKGGMGVVYRAFDIKLNNKPVAVKTIKGVADEASIAQFKKEIDALAELCHANIVNILNVGEFVDGNGKKPYFVMPLLPGQDLDKLLKTTGPRLDPGRLVEIISQACKALQAAHNRNIIHRDLKPSNLFILDDDSVIVIDFGVLHLAGTDSEAVAKGTLPYMAPEQIDGKATTQSDIWSLGVVCYEALTGSRPFNCESVTELISAIRSHIPPSISELNPAVPHSLAQIVHKALAKQPYHRPSSAKEFSELLQRALKKEPLPQFDRSRIKPRLNQIKKSLNESEYQYARELIAELESEGHIDPELSLLRIQIEDKVRARTVYQLLESARLRLEEEDYLGSLQKVQSVLNLNADNVDALALKREIEEKRGSAGVQKWYQIAQQHLNNKSFPKAREAVEEVLKVDPNHRGARELLFEIRSNEQEEKRLRQEIDKLHDSALKAYRNGELSNALNKLERVIVLGKSLSVQSQTDARYEVEYDAWRQELDELQAFYEEGRKALGSKDFGRARDICKQVLNRRPQDPLFQALHIETDEAERQARSEAIAKYHSRIEVETDLEKKLQLAMEARSLFPNEQTFSDAAQLLKQKRDLVKNIAGKARYYESQGLFVEARGQWDTLRNIYPAYPNLQHEIDQLNRKQQQSLEEQAKADRIQKIERALDSGNYPSAGDLLNGALAEFPGKPELVRLKSTLEKAIQDQRHSQTLLEEGRQLAASGNWLPAIQTLRHARELDAHSVPVRLALHAALVNHAQVLLQQDWREALPFRDEALELDPNDSTVAKLCQQIEAASKRERVDCLVQEIKKLRDGGQQQEALRRSKEGLQEFPNDSQLQQLHDALRSIVKRAVLGRTDQMPERAVAVSVGATSTQSQFWPGHAFPSSLEENISSTNAVSGAQSSQTLDAKQSHWNVPAYQRKTSEEKEHTLNRFRFDFKTGAILAASLLLIVTALTFLGKLASNGRLSDTHQQEISRTKQPQAKPEATGISNASPSMTTGSNPDQPTVPLTPRRTLIPVTFWTHPGGARVKVDNRSDLTCSTTPCELIIPTGNHTVIFSADNYRMVKRDIKLPGDNDVSVDLPEEVQSIYVTSKPERLKLTVDGKEHGETPMQLNLAMGEHHFKVTDGKGLVQERTYKVMKDDGLVILRLDLLDSDGATPAAVTPSTPPPSDTILK